MVSSTAIDASRLGLGIFGAILAAGVAFAFIAGKRRIPDVDVFLLLLLEQTKT